MCHKFSEREKVIVHWFVLSIIAFTLYEDGGKIADWSFLALSVIVEFN